MLCVESRAVRKQKTARVARPAVYLHVLGAPVTPHSSDYDTSGPSLCQGRLNATAAYVPLSAKMHKMNHKNPWEVSVVPEKKDFGFGNWGFILFLILILLFFGQGFCF